MAEVVEPRLILSKLKKSIGKREIIHGLNFNIRPGEVFGFIGPNGAGKTTTIRMIVGLINMTEGDVIIDGHSIKRDYANAIKNVGAIVENPEMYPFMTGRQNLKHFARMVKGVDKTRIDDVIRLVGLEKAIDTKVGRYSLGMRQRLGIAQALLHNPSILILDEPTNGLDPAGIREIRQYIRKLATEENVSVIISSHLLSEVELMCDRIGIIKNGQMVAIEPVNANTEESEQNIFIEVSDGTFAAQVLQEAHGLQVTHDNKGVYFTTDKERIPSIISDFVSKNILIYRVEVKVKSLEDKFFNVIGENVIG